MKHLDPLDIAILLKELIRQAKAPVGAQELLDSIERKLAGTAHVSRVFLNDKGKALYKSALLHSAGVAHLGMSSPQRLQWLLTEYYAYPNEPYVTGVEEIEDASDKPLTNRERARITAESKKTAALVRNMVDYLVSRGFSVGEIGMVIQLGVYDEYKEHEFATLADRPDIWSLYRKGYVNVYEDVLQAIAEEESYRGLREGKWTIGHF